MTISHFLSGRGFSKSEIARPILVGTIATRLRTKRKTKKALPWFVAALGMALWSMEPGARADDPAIVGSGYWTGATSNLWTGANWSLSAAGGATTQLPGPNTDVIFSITSGAQHQSTILGADTFVRSLTVNDSTPVSIDSGGSGSFALNMTANGGSGINVNDGAKLTINSTLVLGGSSNSITVSGTGSATINGNLFSNDGIIKNGPGPLTLNGVNNYLGDTAINGGVLSINNGGAIGSGLLNLAAGTELNTTANLTIANIVIPAASGTVTISAAAGTTLTLIPLDLRTGLIVFGSPGNTGTVTFAVPPTGEGDSTTALSSIEVAYGTVRNNVGGDFGFFTYYAASTTVDAGAKIDLADNSMQVKKLMGAGNITLGTNSTTVLTVDSGNFSGTISGAGSLDLEPIALNPFSVIKTPGVLTLTGTNTYTGGTTIGPGVLSINNGGALGSGAVTLEAGGELNGAANATLTNRLIFPSSGTATVSAAPGTTLTLGSMYFGGGSVVFGSPGNTGIVTVGSQGIGSGGVSTATIEVAYGTLRNGSASGLEYITYPLSSTTVDAGATLDVNDFNMEIANLQGAGKVTLGSNASTVLRLDSGNFSGVISGAGGLNIESNGSTVTLTGTNTYQGGTTVNGGVLSINNGNALGSGTVLLGYGGELHGTADLTLANNVTAPLGTSATISAAPGTTLTLQSLNLLAGNTIFGSPGNTGTVAVTGSSPADPNSSIEVAFGTLQNANFAGGLGIFTAHALSTTVDAGATLDLNNAPLPVSKLLGAGNVTLGTGLLILQGGNFSGVISGSGGLLFQGYEVAGTPPGALTLTGANTYQGGTSIVGGILSINNGSALGSGKITIYDGGELNGTADLTLLNNVTMPLETTAVISAAPGTTLTLTSMTLSPGKIVFGSPGNTGTVAVYLLPKPPVFGSSGDPDAAIEVAYGTLQNGKSKFDLSVFTGEAASTTVDAGATLDVNGTVTLVRKLLGAGNITLGTGILEPESGNFSGVISGSGSLFFQGLTVAGTPPGAFTLTGVNTYQGGTTIIGGVLSINNGSALGTGAVQDTGELRGTADLTLNNTVNAGAGHLSGTISAAPGTTLTLRSLNLLTGNTTFGSPGNTGTVAVQPFEGPINVNSSASPTATIEVAYGTLQNVAGGRFNLSLLTAQAASTTVDAGATLDVNNTYLQVSKLLGSGSITMGSQGSLAIERGEFDGVISGNGAVVIQPVTPNPYSLPQIPGTVIFTGANTYQGGTTVGIGTSPTSTLLVNNTTGSGTGSGPVTVLKNGILGGSGTIAGPVTLNAGGVIAPGAGQAGSTLHIGSLTWNGGGSLNLQLGNLSDSLAVAGALTKGTAGAYNLNVTDSGGLGNQLGYTLATYASTTFLAQDFTVTLPSGYSGVLVKSPTGLDLALTAANLLNFAQGELLAINTSLTITSGSVTTASGATVSITGGTLFGPNGFQFDVNGNLYLEGAVVGNATLTGAGTLFLDNILSGDLQVLEGTLGGSGLINGSLFVSGVVSPGHSPGTLRVAGNYTQSPAGLLQIQIGGTNPGQSDLLQVGGQAHLDGTLQLVRLNNFNLSRGDKITFLTAGQGVTGTFASVINPFTSDTILQPVVTYGPNTVSLELVQSSFEKFAETEKLPPNERSIGRALDSIGFDHRGDALLNYLDARSLSKLPGDLEKMDPEQLTSIFTIGVSLAQVQSLNLQRRTDDIRSGSSGFSAAGLAVNGSDPSYSGAFDITTGVAGPTGPDGKESKEMKQTVPLDQRWGAFLSGTGEWVSVGDTQNARGYDLTSGGFTLGVDYKVCPNFAVGLSFGYTGTSSDLTDRGRIWVNGGKMGIYTTTYVGGWYADAAVNGGYNSYDTRRSALQGEARSTADGGELNALFGTGYDFKKGALTFGPTATFNYTYVGLNGFTEHGSLAPLDFHGHDQESMRTALGMKVSYEWKVGKALIKPELRAAWQHEFGDATYSLNSSFANGASSVFTVDGPEIGRDSLLLSGGFAIQWNNRFSTYVYYDGELARTNYHSSTVSGGFRIDF